MKSIDELEKEIQELENHIIALEKEIEIIKKLTPEQQLAEYMHNKLCHHNHTDGCSWHYEKDWNDSAHYDYLKKASFMIKIIRYKKDDDLTTCKSIVNIIKG